MQWKHAPSRIQEIASWFLRLQPDAFPPTKFFLVNEAAILRDVFIQTSVISGVMPPDDLILAIFPSLPLSLLGLTGYETQPEPDVFP